MEGELNWEVIYIGSAQSEKYDQNLDSFTISPVTKGIM
jgi:hypothetical protein